MNRLESVYQIGWRNDRETTHRSGLIATAFDVDMSDRRNGMVP